MFKKLLGAVFGLCLLASPVSAAITITQKTFGTVNTNATLNMSSQSYTSGRLIVVLGYVRLANISDTISVNGATSGAFTIYECTPSAGGLTPSTNRTFIGYAVAGGGSEVVTLTASNTATALYMSSNEVAGQDTLTPEDVSVRACNGGSATVTPTVTSGTPSQAGDLFVSPYGSGTNSTGFSWTEDTGNGWTQLGSTGASTNITSAASYNVNLGSSAITHAPTTTSKTYAMIIMGFKAASVGTPVGGSLPLLGVGN